MLRSMAAAISAMRNHQTFLDVVSTNISNINTTGFKASRVSFQSMLSQTLQYASASREGVSGSNPVQVGLGMQLGGIDSVFTQGNLRATGKTTDMAIQGRGFFVLGDGSTQYYSRDGMADVGTDGYLVNPTSGLRILGWTAADDGTVDTNAGVGPISIPYGSGEARATTNVDFLGNLDSEAIVDDTVDASVGVYDSFGQMHMVTLTFTKTAANEWGVSVASSDPSIETLDLTGTPIEFTATGQLDPASPTPTISITYNHGAAPSEVSLDLTNLTQLGQPSEANAVSQDGLQPGSLIDFSITEYGEVLGLFSNGMSRVIGQIALASFANPGGLLRIGQNLFQPSPNSGVPQIGAAGQGDRGEISAGFLEMSNVDLAREFTDMIVAQRGFQANSRVVTTSDEVLQELVNLKR